MVEERVGQSKDLDSICGEGCKCHCSIWWQWRGGRGCVVVRLWLKGENEMIEVLGAWVVFRKNGYLVIQL